MLLAFNSLCNINDKENWTIKGRNALNNCKGEGEERWTTECMKQEGFSQQCSNCFGKLMACARSKCVLRCCLGFCKLARTCLTCAKDYCMDSFRKCSGLSSPF